jgi:transcriptional regulator with XRE-family HTH domain
MRLLDWRQSEGLTLKQAAARLGVPLATLSNIERGKRGASRVVERKIYNGTLCRVSAHDLWEAWDESNPERRRPKGGAANGKSTRKIEKEVRR